MEARAQVNYVRISPRDVYKRQHLTKENAARGTPEAGQKSSRPERAAVLFEGDVRLLPTPSLQDKKERRPCTGFPVWQPYGGRGPQPLFHLSVALC